MIVMYVACSCTGPRSKRPNFLVSHGSYGRCRPEVPGQGQALPPLIVSSSMIVTRLMVSYMREEKAVDSDSKVSASFCSIGSLSSAVPRGEGRLQLGLWPCTPKERVKGIFRSPSGHRIMVGCVMTPIFDPSSLKPESCESYI